MAILSTPAIYPGLRQALSYAGQQTLWLGYILYKFASKIKKTSQIIIIKSKKLQPSSVKVHHDTMQRDSDRTISHLDGTAAVYDDGFGLSADTDSTI